MRILDQSGTELSRDQVDLEKGYLVDDVIVTGKTEEKKAVPQIKHTTIRNVYFSDGSVFSPTTEDDPHLVKDSSGNYSFRFVEGEEKKSILGTEYIDVTDQVAQPAQPAQDITEKVERYILYTEEELKQRKEFKEKQEKTEAFINKGPDRLDLAETNISDLTVSVADLLAG